MVWRLVQTEHSIPIGRLDSDSADTILPSINFGQRLLHPASVFSPTLFEQLSQWQHDEQYVRWARLLIHFQEIGAEYQVLFKDRRFKLVSNGEFVYKAHRGWKRSSCTNPRHLPRDCRTEVEEMLAYHGKFSIWKKGDRLMLFNEQFGNTQIYKFK